MAVKFYEVAPELRESPIDDYDYEPGYWLENVSVTGNSYYCDRKSEGFKNAELLLEYIDDEYDFNSLVKYFKITDDGSKLYALSKAIICKKDYHYRDETVIPLLLEALTGEKYDSREIHGCYQGEWNRAYFPVSMGDDFIEWFETAYFNNGSEWIVEDNDDRISLYSCEWSNEKVKADLANQYGVAVDQCEFYKFDGYVRRPKYKVI